MIRIFNASTYNLLPNLQKVKNVWYNQADEYESLVGRRGEASSYQQTVEKSQTIVTSVNMKGLLALGNRRSEAS